jgi:hypothetical protein
MLNDKQNKIIYYIILFLFIITLITYATTKYLYRPVCPDDFKNSKDKIRAFENWIDKEFTPKSQETFYEDLQQARIEFYKQNKCVKELKRIENYMSAK